MVIPESLQTFGAAAVSGVFATSAYFSPWLGRQVQIRNIRRQAAKSRILALTYDDGPSSVLTPQVLNLLLRHNAVATFFLLGQNAERYPDIVHRTIREGHDVGCHSFEHINAWKVMPGRAIQDIRKGYNSLASWISPNGMFRPPNGKMTLPTYLAVRGRGAPIWWWTIDSGDTRDVLPNPTDVADKVSKDGGGVVLMHDLDRTRERNDFVLEVTALLLNMARHESLRIKPLRELC